jgi:hypothetical protein
MEPEDRLDQHVENSGQVVMTARVANLVSQDRINMPVIEVLGDSFRPYQHRPEEFQRSQAPSSLETAPA